MLGNNNSKIKKTSIRIQVKFFIFGETIKFFLKYLLILCKINEIHIKSCES
jgi:hypothetical protein